MMKLSDLVKVLGCEYVEVCIPVKDGEIYEKRWFRDAADLLLKNKDFPVDAKVDDVSHFTSYMIECEPYPFPPEKDGDVIFDVKFSSEEMKLIEELADGWIMDPDEVVQKIVKEHLKSIKEEPDHE
jgi:hypothetical protein